MAGVVAKFATSQERFADKLPQGATDDAAKNNFLGKNILFYIERSNNNNSVMYEANMEGDKLNEKGKEDLGCGALFAHECLNGSFRLFLL